MKVVFILLLATLMAACSKPEAGVDGCEDLRTLNWLTARKAEYGSCGCLIGARVGNYENQQVIEFYLYDPACNGYNTIYKMDGTRWFFSYDTIYTDYVARVKDLRIIWTCTGGDQ